MFEASCPLPPCITHSISPFVNTINYHGIFNIINEPTLTLYQLKIVIYLHILSIYLMSFFCLESHPMYHSTLFTISLSLLLLVTASQTFLVFDGLDNFEPYWPDILLNDPQFECIWCFIVILLVFWVCRWITTKAKCYFHHILLSLILHTA